MIDLKAYHLAMTYPAYYPTTGPVIEPLVVEEDPELWGELMEEWDDYLEMEGQ